MRVNFLIVGTQKGGTSALASFLSQVPEVYMAPYKEVHYFDDEEKYGDGSDHAGYHAFFSTYAGEPLVGEATPIYMYLPHVAPRIQAYNPAMKLIALVRDPVERAYSHYRMARRWHYERLPFEAALAAEPLRLWRARGRRDMDSAWRHHSYTDRGFYSGQLRHLLHHFPREQLLLLRSEDLSERHDETLRRVADFLGTPFSSLPPAARVHEGGETAPMSAGARRYLRWRYRREAAELDRLLGSPGSR